VTLIGGEDLGGRQLPAHQRGVPVSSPTAAPARLSLRPLAPARFLGATSMTARAIAARKPPGVNGRPAQHQRLGAGLSRVQQRGARR